MIVAVTGTNSFLAKAEVRQLIDGFVKAHGDLALERLDATEVSDQDIIGAVEALPFLASKKMVVVQDMSANKAASEALEQIIERAGDSTDLLIVEGKLDKRGSHYKQLKKLTDFREFNDLDEANLASWLEDEAKRLGGTLSRADAQYLVQRVGVNQMMLNRELEKLIQYNLKISRQSIDELTIENPSSTIFNLIDSAFSGDLGQALRIYEEQRRQRVEPQAIHGLLVWQMHNVSITAAAPAGTSSSDIAKQSGISPFVAQKSQRIAHKMGRRKIIEFMRLLRDIDYRSKHETLDYDEALRYAIVKLAS
jgi:DNA polymerase-3 subunit delta